MSIKQFVGRAANRLLKNVGYQLRRTDNDTSMEAALMRRARSGVEIGTIIDVGASDGRWSKIAKQYFPSAFCLLIEANKFHAPGLQQFKDENPHSDYQIAAAGDSIGEIYFQASDPFGGLASHTLQSPDSIVIPVTTVDEQVRMRELTPPYLLKLDTHGFEVPILLGAKDLLKHTALIIVEVYNFQIASDSLKFWEMCSLLEEKGFRPIDLCEPMYRPKDQAFWQMDLFFVPSTSREFGSNEYQ